MSAPATSFLLPIEITLDPDAATVAPMTETYEVGAKYNNFDNISDFVKTLLFHVLPVPVFNGKDSPREPALWIPGNSMNGDKGPIRDYKVMAIGKMAGVEENRYQRNFIGNSGKLIQEVAAEIGVSIDDWYVTNVVRFLPPDGGKTLKGQHIQDGMFLLAQEIAIIRPKYILLFGADAVKAMFGKHCTLEKVRSTVFYMRGVRGIGQIPETLNDTHEAEKEYGIKIYPTIHPAHVLREVCLRPGFVSDMAKFAVLSSGKDIAASNEKLDYKFVKTSSELEAVVNRVSALNCFELSVDCEWGGDDPYRGALRSIQFSWAPNTSCVVILKERYGIDAQSLDERMKMLTLLKQLFSKKGMKLIGHNFRSDAKWLEYLGIPVMKNFFFDTMLADHVLNENAEHGLESCSVRYTTMGRYDWALTKWLSENHYNKKKMKQLGFMEVPDELFLPYAASDPDCTFRIYKVLAKELEKPALGELKELFYKIIMPCNLPIHEIEMTGIQADRERMVDLVWKYNSKKNELEEELKAVTGRPEFNPRSIPQTKDLLFKQLGLMPFKTTEKPSRMWEDIINLPLEIREKLNPSTDSESLEALACDDKTGTVSLLRDFKVIDQVTKNFLRLPDSKEYGDDEFSEGLVGKTDPDGRLRTSLSQMSETGRQKSYDPNLQNLPKKQDSELSRIMGEDVPKIRSCFVAPDGHVIIEADYDSAEIYTLGYLGMCPKLVMDARGDLHSRGVVTGMGVPKWPGYEEYKKPPKEWKEEHEALRIAQKAVNFGIFYLRGAKAIAREITEATKGKIKCDFDMAQHMIDFFYITYPEIKSYVDICKKSVIKPGYITNAYGRRRRFFLKDDDDRSFIAAAQREACNTPIQGTVADTLNRALYNLYMWRYLFPNRAKYRILMAIHDAVLLEAPGEFLEVIINEVVPVCMTNSAVVPSWNHAGIWGPTESFKLNTNVEVGKRWGVKPTSEELRSAGVCDKLIERFVK